MGQFPTSMLGTWEGPQWTPAHSLTTVLETIQSLMNKDPYYNEPVVFPTDQGVVQVSRNQLAEQQLKEGCPRLQKRPSTWYICGAGRRKPYQGACFNCRTPQDSLRWRIFLP
ncbi:Ubiquitin-conjugating enzyme E2 Z [Holothuria leucospilota]|uniref:Ubiquitin-conjugating enzyme E2 Z n=1 Tax=Holothuria leucospilota TaxID=206669 RepID=A0A9Q1C1H3_HOLLE|nr:Ubiquitin-conjugating enzyme E2 Z [Holothuria leucospilota]